jgi:t-SNARE complex subunit (syntaxin)
MSTMSTGIRRRRTRTLAMYGVTIVTIALVVLVVNVVGHEAGSLYAKVSSGLAL